MMQQMRKTGTKRKDRKQPRTIGHPRSSSESFNSIRVGEIKLNAWTSTWMKSPLPASCRKWDWLHTWANRATKRKEMQQAHTRVHHRRSSGRPSTERRDGDAGRPPGSSRRWEMTATCTAPPPLPRARRSSTGGHCGAEGKEKRMRQRHRHRSRCSICQGAGGDRGAGRSGTERVGGRAREECGRALE